MITKFNTAVPAAAPSTGKSGGGVLGWVLGLALVAGAIYLVNKHILNPKPEEKSNAEGEDHQQTEEAESTPA